jgi:2'-5' RNA ligase
MKIFSIYTTVSLVDKPKWLEVFRNKYNQVYDLHVTLKQPCYIEEHQLSDVKEKLAKFFEDDLISGHEIQVHFTKLSTDNTDPIDGVIMIEAQNQILTDLQQSITSLLSDYKQYYEPASEEWEHNFKPHITIASNLTHETFRLAKEDLPKDYSCVGLIKKVVLAVIDSKDAGNAQADKQTVVYKL